MGFFSSILRKSNTKNKMIEWAIETLGQQGSVIGTAYKEISYDDVILYIKNNKCVMLNSIKNANNGWMDFEAKVNGNKYIVTLSRTQQGDGSVLTSEKV